MNVNWRKAARETHIHLSFIFTGMIIIFCVSGILMNHLSTWGWDASYLPVFKEMTEMHYNPGAAWTWFADIFTVCLAIITFTGIILVRDKKGIKGIGGIEILIGIAIPIILYYICI